MTSTATAAAAFASSGAISQFSNITIGGKVGGVRGVLKLTQGSILWKPDGSSNKIESVNTNDIEKSNWIRITPRVFQLYLTLKGGSNIKFDGFKEQDLDLLKRFFDNININITTSELSTKGSNFGEIKIGPSMITFTSGDKIAFEFPTSEVTQTIVNPNHKNELTLEFQRASNAEKDDESLVEIRFFTPTRPSEENQTISAEPKAPKEKKAKPVTLDGDGNEVMKDLSEDEEEEEYEDEEEEEEERPSTVEIIQQMIKDKSDVSNVGKSLVVLSNIPFLTPRGRIDIEMYPTFLKLHGKTHDYKVAYNNISRLFQFDRPDRHMNFVISLEPPIRQGKTKYAHLVIQLPSVDEEHTLDLNLTDELVAKYPELTPQVKGPMNVILAKLLKVLTDKKMTSQGTFKGETGVNTVKCSLKANEGYLYPLERAFFFLHKPPIYIQYDEILNIEFSRVSMAVIGGRGGGNSSRTFDLNINLKSGGPGFSFTSIPRTEYNHLFNFLKEKKLSIENPEIQNPGIAAMLVDDDSDDEDYESGGEESESEDESDLDDEDVSEEEKKTKKKHKSDK